MDDCLCYLLRAIWDSSLDVVRFSIAFLKSSVVSMYTMVCGKLFQSGTVRGIVENLWVSVWDVGIWYFVINITMPESGTWGFQIGEHYYIIGRTRVWYTFLPSALWVERYCRGTCGWAGSRVGWIIRLV